ncbi:MAG: TlpA family protein disulfide reductase [Dehalococcoidia bacterium]
MPSLSQRLPLVAGVLGAVAVVVVTLASRDDGVDAPLSHEEATVASSAAPETSAATEVSGEREVPRFATPFDAPALSPAATPFTLPSDQGALRELGRRLVTSPEKRPTAASFQVETASYADGSTFALRGGEPNSVTVVFFMAAWCPTCVSESIALRELHREYEDSGVAVLILDVDQNETEEDLARFRELTGNGEHYWAMDRDFSVARALDVNVLDATVVIDQQGRIAYRDGSPSEYEVLAAVVEALLEEGA